MYKADQARESQRRHQIGPRQRAGEYAIAAIVALCWSCSGDCGLEVGHTARGTGEADRGRVETSEQLVEEARERPPPAALETMLRVPAGPFWLEEPGSSDWKQVQLGEFFIDRTEVTADDYARCVEAGACTAPDLQSCDRDLATWLHPERGRHPINCVGWEQAVAYCAWLGLRPPTQLEWEKAARGDDGRLYPWGDEPANCGLAVLAEEAEAPGCGAGTTAEVASRPTGASPYGALDMAGNVAEWSGDVRRIREDGALATAHGGSFRDDPEAVQSFWFVLARDSREHGREDIGFRCAYSAAPTYIRPPPPSSRDR